VSATTGGKPGAGGSTPSIRVLRLYHLPLCPFSRKVRVALREKGLASELVETQPWNIGEEFLALNPAGEVPVLADGERAVCDSGAIVEYLEEAYPQQPGLLGRSVDQRAETRRLLAWFDSKFAREVTDLLWREKLVKRWKRQGFPRSEALREGAQSIRGHLAYIDYLYQDRKWLAGPELSMADIAAAAHLSVLDYLGDVPWREAPGAKEWYAKMKSRPSMRPLLMDRLMGLKPPPHYDDPDF
jgi:glutathione S-transferase